MSQYALRIDGISKMYRVGTLQQEADTLAGRVASLLRSPLDSFRSLRSLSRFDDEAADDVLWALRDVSFDVPHGDVVGLIGRNGAGKSTLLKVLSRITDPSRGRIEVYGRIASLLEVGTGFNDDLTGRENAYLNGAILGMTKAEVSRKFDEIVAFSEIEKFIDTPVKRYSSGMKVRLAFAVAAHLEPEILLVDEVLAVGDVAFQRKCLGKMDDVAGEGRTVIFVSHHMSMIQALCKRGIVMQHGAVAYDGGVDEAIAEYLRDMEEEAQDSFEDNPRRSGTRTALFTSIEILSEAGEAVEHVISGQAIGVRFRYQNTVPGGRATVSFGLRDAMGASIATFRSDLTDFAPLLDDAGTLTCWIPRLPLLPGAYRLNSQLLVNGEVADAIPNMASFQVASSVYFANGRTPNPKYSQVMVDHEWDHVPEPVSA